MDYVKIVWVHSYEDEPSEIHMELDSSRFEIRKIEVYADGSFGYADKTRSLNETRLSLEPFPKISEYNRLNSEVEDNGWDEQLIAHHTSRKEFLYLLNKYSLDRLGEK